MIYEYGKRRERGQRMGERSVRHGSSDEGRNDSNVFDEHLEWKEEWIRFTKGVILEVCRL
jgi:hypothetical protein